MQRHILAFYKVAKYRDNAPIYIEDITWWREDKNFMFEWQEQYLTSEHSE